MQLTLWDRMVMPMVRLISPSKPPKPCAKGRQRADASTNPKGAEGSLPSPPPATSRNRCNRNPARRTLPASESMEARYERIAREMLARYEIKVRKWRTSSSGVAWELRYRDGSIKRFIESPRPRGPMSMAIFLHEIGHHAIGFGIYKPRCLEEYHAWAWSLRTMDEHGLNVTDQVRRRMHESLWYAISKARRRGIKSLPPELHAFTERPPRRSRRGSKPSR